MSRGASSAPGSSAIPGADGLRFSHVLIREAAYDSLPKEVRAELHERVATWLEQASEGRTAEYDEIIGHHLEQAARYKHELGETDEELASRAGTRLANAGRRAREHRNPAAVGLLSRALELLSARPQLRPPPAPGAPWLTRRSPNWPRCSTTRCSNRS